MTGIHEVGSYPEEVEGDLAELIGEINSVGPKDPLRPERIIMRVLKYSPLRRRERAALGGHY